MGPLAAPIIGALGSVVGGLLNKPKNEYVVPDYAKIRAKAEAAGVNPLFAMANAPGQVVQTQGYMGSAVADAAMIMADAVAKQPGAGKLSQVQAQNRALSKQVQSLTLRPKVGGIYAQRGVTPSLRKALGVGDVSQGVRRSSSFGADNSGLVPSVGVGSGGSARGLADTLPIDPRREVDNAKITTTSGFMVADNPNVDFPIYVPSLDGDEALTLGEMPTALAAVAGSYIYHLYGSSKFSNPNWRAKDAAPDSVREAERRVRERDRKGPYVPKYMPSPLFGGGGPYGGIIGTKKGRVIPGPKKTKTYPMAIW